MFKPEHPIFLNYLDSLPIPNVDDQGAGVVYYGYTKTLGVAPNAAKWQIRRATTTAGVTITEYAEGNTDFAHKWSDRATLNYKR